MLQNLNVQLYDFSIMLAEMNDTAGINLVHIMCRVVKCTVVTVTITETETKMRTTN